VKTHDDLIKTLHDINLSENAFQYKKQKKLTHSTVLKKQNKKLVSNTLANKQVINRKGETIE